MAFPLRHRGPDDSGVWAEGSVALAHRRLSVLELSSLGHQPMISRDGRYVLVFNGEIYNFPALGKKLSQSGCHFRGHSDTEVLLEAISAWGLEDALKRANGMFALALYDRREESLALARDRIGQKPLYYGWAGKVFGVSSELRAFRTLDGFPANVDRMALSSYLVHGYVPAPLSIYRNIFKLSPGCFMQIPVASLGKQEPLPDPQPYWSFNEVAVNGQRDPIHVPPAEAESMLDELLQDAVRQCMVSDVPLGGFLSGGIDSTTVVALMQAQSNRPVRTFTIGFENRGYNEAVHAAKVAQHIGTDHTELYLDDATSRDVVPDLASIYDEPFADSSQIPTALVSRLARRSVTVSLSGDGGDELFGGYNRYVWGRNADLFRRVTPRFLRAMAAWAVKNLPLSFWDGLFGNKHLPNRFRVPQAGDKINKLGGILDAGSREEIYQRIISIWTNPQAVVIGGQPAATLLFAPERWPAISFSDQMMLLDAVTYLPDDILVKLDRASMACSLEARVPLLDHRVVEFAWRLPHHYRTKHGQRKQLLRSVLARYVPPSLTERPKMGFGVPIDAWLRGPLRDWAETNLDSRRLEVDGFFDPKAVRKRWNEHVSGRRNWQQSLWCILMFQTWQERWLNP